MTPSLAARAHYYRVRLMHFVCMTTLEDCMQDGMPEHWQQVFCMYLMALECL
jgi:hypothetical protein